MSQPTEKETTKISKFLSLVLRHQPEIIGLNLDENGWADTSELLSKMNSNNHNSITMPILEHVVATNSKKRFAFNDDKTRIRANQGHSIDIDLGLDEKQPPEYLYHGTAVKSVGAIMNTSLEKQLRQHVHLSLDYDTALSVGKRHGNPQVFVIETGAMHRDGYKFYLSDNGVWLTDHVPAKYLKLD